MKPIHSPSKLLLLAVPFLLGACQTFTASHRAPDHRIKIVHNGQETVTLPPKCTDWEQGWGHPLSNDPWPSYGCSQARNLAAQVVDPLDLVEGRELDAPEPVNTTATIFRYQSGQTTPFIDPNAENPADIRKMKDTRIGGAPQK